MSKQNKQNIIPSHEEFIAFVNGNMSSDRYSEMEVTIESDAFLSDALDGYHKNSDWVGSISSGINSRLKSEYPIPKTGGGFKYYVIAGVALVSVMVLVFISNMDFSSENPKLSSETVLVESSDHDETTSGEVNETDPELNDGNLEDPSMGEIGPAHNQEVNSSLSENEDKKDAEVEENNGVDDNRASYEEEEIVDIMDFKKNDKNTKEQENAASGSSVRLVLFDAQIGLKGPPEKVRNQSTKIVAGQVITKNKTQKINYNQDDLPTYYGGDDALKAEIKGSIRPVVVQLNSKYDRVIAFEFIVNANGGVDSKSLKFLGNPYPEIRSQIVKMIENFPMFKPGKAKGKKGRIQYSIMLKY